MLIFAGFVRKINNYLHESDLDMQMELIHSLINMKHGEERKK